MLDHNQPITPRGTARTASRSDLTVLLQAAWTESQSYNYEGAKRDYLLALKMDPQSKTAWNNWGRFT
jgi:hypothetical protein